MSLGKIIELPRITDPRGNLTVAEANKNIPFDIKRVYWLYDVPGGECRGGHAHKQIKETLIAVSGSLHVTLDNGKEKQTSDFYDENDYIYDYNDFLQYINV